MNMWDQQAENQVWMRFIQGDESAFKEIYQAYFSVLYRYGLKLYHDNEVIEDCLHDFFLYLYNSRANLSEVRSLKAYLFRSFRRSIFRTLEKSRNGLEREKVFTREMGDEDLSLESVLVTEEGKHAMRNQLRSHLQLLPPRQKEILYLKFFDNLSYAEIVEVTQLNYQTVVNHLNKALKNLRKYYRLSENMVISMFALIFSLFV